jgi:hypothetical protein
VSSRTAARTQASWRGSSSSPRLTRSVVAPAGGWLARKGLEHAGRVQQTEHGDRGQAGQDAGEMADDRPVGTGLGCGRLLEEQRCARPEAREQQRLLGQVGGQPADRDPDRAAGEPVGGATTGPKRPTRRPWSPLCRSPSTVAGGSSPTTMRGRGACLEPDAEYRPPAAGQPQTAAVTFRRPGPASRPRSASRRRLPDPSPAPGVRRRRRSGPGAARSDWAGPGTGC